MVKTPPASQTDNTKPSPTFLHSPWLWWGAAALSLALGFADLWRGGETLASIFLVLGYLVLIPMAILKR